MRAVDEGDTFLAGGFAATYEWVTGRGVGEFLRALRDDALLLGARCPRCALVHCPPEETCWRCGSDVSELVPVGPQGVVTAQAPAWGEVPDSPCDGPFAYVAVQLDGSDTSLIHVAPGEEGCRLAVGDRVEARFRPTRTGSILDVAGFVRAHRSQLDDPQELGHPAGGGAPIRSIAGAIDVPFRHSTGRLFPGFYASLKEGRIQGVRCPSCTRVLLPPRPMCGACFVDVEPALVDVADHGCVRTFTNVHLSYEGQPTQPPYCYALIVLDGADGEFHHIIEAAEPVRVGMRVKAVWRPRDERIGSFRDIQCFVPESSGNGL